MIKRWFKSLIVFLLEKEAEFVLKKYSPKIVAVTGTVGKTSTKDAIYTALSRFYFVRKSRKSFNSEIGVPLTILNCPNAGNNPLGWLWNIIEGLGLILLPNYYPEWLVLEVGTDHPGDIQKITRWLKPDIVVITRLSRMPVHVEAFDSVEDLFKEKGYLVSALKHDGTLILNADDNDVLLYKNLTPGNVLLYGNGNGSDIRSTDYAVVYGEHKEPTGITFNVSADGESFPVHLTGTLGEAHGYHVLAALAVCKVLNEQLSIAAKSFNSYESAPGRLRLVPGIKDTVIIDDSYNSSPIAVEEALHTLDAIEHAGRKIAVLGDMLELGRFSIEAHKKMGMEAARVADMLVAVGVRSRSAAEAALGAGLKEDAVLQFEEACEAGVYLQNLIKKGDVILVKGSQGMRMERVVEEIMAHPEEKEYLLVRQDKEWQKR